MKKIIGFLLTAALITGSAIPAMAADKITLASVLGDVSRGNHPQAGLDGTNIIVPRPAKSQYEPIQVLDTSNVKPTDITGHWAESAIREFIEKGYIAGYPDGTFKPDNPVTYAEFATIVARLNIKPVRFGGGIFYTGGTIFNKDKWYYNAILIASEVGVFSEAGKRVYGAYSLINSSKPYYLNGDDDALNDAQRQYVALYLANMLEYKESNFAERLPYSDISDIDIRHDNSAEIGIKRMVANGVVSGYPDNTFRPTATISRAELVTILTRILGKYQWDMLTIHDNLYGNYNLYNWQEEKKLLDLVNAERTKNGLKEVKYDPNLTALARTKVIDMVVNNYYSHISPTFGDPCEMSQYFGYLRYAGENLTGSHESAQSIHGAWTTSKSHYDNYMRKGNTLFGAALGETGSVEWVTDPSFPSVKYPKD